MGFKSNLPDGKFVEVKKNFLVTSFNIDLTYDYPAQVSKIEKIENIVKVNGSKGLQPEYLQKYGDASEIQPADVDAREDFSEHLDPSAKVLIKEDDADAVAETDNSKKQDDKMNMSFSVKVPSFASYNNADSMNLNVYTWNILRDKPTVIKLQYVQYSGFAIGFVIVLGIALLILLARKIKKHDAQRRIDNQII